MPRMLPDGRRLGAHLPLGHGMLKAVDRAHEIGATALQVFADNPTAWRRRMRPPREAPAFRERLAELECVYASSPVGLAVLDRDLRYVRVNQAIADMNGLSIEEVVGKRYRDLAPETADLAEHFLSLVAARGQSVRNLEVRARPPGDPEREHVYLMSLDPMRNADGEVTGLVSAVQDVTDLRRAEARAARRLQDLQLVYANAPVGLCHVEAGELRVLHMNARFARLSDRPPEELVGRCLPELLGDEIARQLVPLLRQVARTGMSAQNVEIRGRPSARSARA